MSLVINESQIPSWALETACSEPSIFDEEDIESVPSVLQHLEKPQIVSPSGSIDWGSYLSWSEVEISARERTRSNILILNGRACEIDQRTTEGYIQAEIQLTQALILFKDLPRMCAGSGPLDREALMLAYDCVRREFLLLRVESLPKSLDAVCPALKAGTEVMRIRFQDFCNIFEGRCHVDESQSTWAPEKGFQICVWLCIATFIVDFQEAFDPCEQGLWTWDKLFKTWRQRLEEDEVVVEMIDLDCLDIGEQNLTELFLDEAPFDFEAVEISDHFDLGQLERMIESEVDTIFSPRSSASTQPSVLEEAGIECCDWQLSPKVLQKYFISTQTNLSSLKDTDLARPFESAQRGQAIQQSAPEALFDSESISPRTICPPDITFHLPSRKSRERFGSKTITWANPWTQNEKQKQSDCKSKSSRPQEVKAQRISSSALSGDKLKMNDNASKDESEAFGMQRKPGRSSGTENYPSMDQQECKGDMVIVPEKGGLSRGTTRWIYWMEEGLEP